MCEICEKVDFAIETIESLFPANELVEMWAKHSPMAKRVMETDNKESVETSAKANFVCLFIARYAVKQGFAPVEFENILNHMLSVEYFKETQARIIEKMTGKRPDFNHPEGESSDYKS